MTSLLSAAGDRFNIAPLILDHVDNFHAVRGSCPRITLVVAVDNEATLKIIAKGRSVKLRHVNRVRRVDLDWMFDY